jgi:hypothetical protein
MLDLEEDTPMLKPIEPTFDNVAWDGNNLSTVQAFVDRYVGPSENRVYTIISEAEMTAEAEFTGGLRIDERGVIQLMVPVTHSILRGPIFGTDATQAGWQVLSPAEVATGYEVIPG